MTMIYQGDFNESTTFDANQSHHVQIKSHAHGILYINIADVDQCDIKIEVEAYAQAKIFIHYQSSIDTHFDCHVDMYKDASCQMCLLDMEKTSLYWKHFVDLKEEGANFEILSGQLCMAHMDKVCSMEIRHNAPHSYGEIKNFAVLMDDGHYEMVANGNITKGCFDAHSHQATRVLTLGKNHITKCIPLLLIDENDVRASHALSVGQPDEDQMYYLQSRGLTKKQAIGLLSVGYLLPVIKMVEDPSLQEKLQLEMEGKVGLYGSK